MLSSTTIRGDIAQAVYEGRSNKANLFIGAQVMPIYVSDIRSGEYLKINLGQSEALNDDATKIAAGSAYPRVSRKFVSDTFATTEFGLEEILPDQTQRDLARFLDVEVALADMLLNQIQIGHETRVAAAAFAANGLTAISGAGATAAYTEANITSFDLPADVAAGKLELAKVGVLPNTLILSATLFERVRRSTKVQNQMFGVVATNSTRLLSEQEVAQAVGVDQVLVGRAPKNSAAKGKAYSGTFIWSDTYIALAHVVGGEFVAGGFGRSILWGADSPVPFVAETYRDEARRSNVLRVRQHVSEKVIDGSSIIRITTGL
jgi:hypothetical protein